LRALVLIVDSEGKVLDVQRNAVAKNHHHEHCTQQGEGHTHFVAQQFFGFTAGDGDQSGQAKASFTDRRRCLDDRRGARLCRRFRAGPLIVLCLLKAGNESGFQRVTLELLLQRIGGIAGKHLACVHQ